MMSYFMYVITITILFCGIAVLALKLWGKVETFRMRSPRHNSDLQMLGALSASATVKLLAIRFQNRYLLLAVSRQEVALLSEVAAQAKCEEKTIDFAGLLDSARQTGSHKMAQAVTKIVFPQQPDRQRVESRRTKSLHTKKIAQ
ncbi:MAG: flagellar biosynthetic protein FliO [Sphingopyxis sp.]